MPAPAKSSVHSRLSASERREQLIEIAIDLFSRKGFKGTTTREIAAASGVTEAIIFRHFESKEQLYTAIIDRKVNSPETAEWVAELRKAMDREDDEAVVRQLIRGIIRTHQIDPQFERLMLYAALEGNEIALEHMRQVSASIVNLYKKYLLRRQKQGALRPCEPEVALIAIVGMARSYATCKYIHGLEEQCLSDEQALDGFTRIAMDGLGLGLAKPRKGNSAPKSK